MKLYRTTKQQRHDIRISVEQWIDDVYGDLPDDVRAQMVDCEVAYRLAIANR